jgi:hypothetical protein
VSDDKMTDWLSERERHLLAYLGVVSVADQTGADEQTCADALDDAAGRGEARADTDGHNVWLTVCGHVLVHTTRSWLKGHTEATLN